MKVLFCFFVLLGLPSFLFASLEPTGMAKPIADLRDYNGTYEGAVGTGTIGYSTLYRDNQDDGALSGCRGEGCGRHPGVDIPVISGTSVYNALGGVVVLSECNESWGGLVVVRATSPMDYGQKIYLVYAHLRSRRYRSGMLVFPGDYVNTGTKIGESGGDPNKDKCAGRSTGSHLHFQIDRDDGNTHPYFPALSQLNQRDDNFEVTSRTYNPVTFVVGGYRWTFAQNGNRELWDLFNFQSWGVSNNALYVDAGYDPYIRRGGLTNCGWAKPCSSNITAEAINYPQVYLDMYNQCSTGVGKVYFITNSDPIWNEYKAVPFISNYGPLSTHVRMDMNSKWTGTITGLRVDPAENCNPYSWDPTYYGEVTIER